MKGKGISIPLPFTEEREEPKRPYRRYLVLNPNALGCEKAETQDTLGGYGMGTPVAGGLEELRGETREERWERMPSLLSSVVPLLSCSILVITLSSSFLSTSFVDIFPKGTGDGRSKEEGAKRTETYIPYIPFYHALQAFISYMLLIFILFSCFDFRDRVSSGERQKGKSRKKSRR